MQCLDKHRSYNLGLFRIILQREGGIIPQSPIIDLGFNGANEIRQQSSFFLLLHVIQESILVLTPSEKANGTLPHASVFRTECSGYRRRRELCVLA